MLTNRALILIDEPESFLHPPQIRSLAKMIVQHSGTDTQIIVSTHSHDFVQALIDFGSARTTVVRLSRQISEDREINSVKKLDPNAITALWRDPILRMSDALTSLFHHVSILIEGDSDARFFKNMFDSLSDDQNFPLDLKIIHCGGKDRIEKLASALRAIGIPLLCIVDIDILNDREKMLRLFRAFGGDPDSIKNELSYLLKFVDEQRAVESAGSAYDEIKSIFETTDLRKPITKEIALNIGSIIRKSSAWSLVQRSGESFFTRGEPTNKFRSVINQAMDLGIFINPHGELENLCKTVEARKGEWLNLTLEKDFKQDEDLAEARSFAEQILAKGREIAGFNAI